MHEFVDWGFSTETAFNLKSSLAFDLHKNQKEITALDYCNDSEKLQKIKFNQISLDQLTKGGIDIGSITEICGEAGSGKTQLCLQLALNVQMPPKFGGLDGKVIYISVDKNFAIKRLKQMEEVLLAKCSKELHSIKYMENIMLFHIRTAKRFHEHISTELPIVLKRCSNIKLVIIDSIAGIYRMDQDYIKRAVAMRNTINFLESLANIYNFAVVTPNHMTAVITDDRPNIETMAPALGLQWDSLVSTRLQIEKTEKFVQYVGWNFEIEKCRVRRMQVIYSPRLPMQSANFIVTSSGISDIN